MFETSKSFYRNEQQRGAGTGQIGVASASCLGVRTHTIEVLGETEDGVDKGVWREVSPEST